MKRVLLAILLVTAFACNNEKKETTNEEVATKVVESKPNELVVEIFCKSSKADEFKLSLNNIVVNSNQKKEYSSYSKGKRIVINGEYKG